MNAGILAGRDVINCSGGLSTAGIPLILRKPALNRAPLQRARSADLLKRDAYPVIRSLL